MLTSPLGNTLHMAPAPVAHLAVPPAARCLPGVPCLHDRPTLTHCTAKNCTHKPTFHSQVVKELVRPATAHTKTDFVQCLVGGQLPPSYSLPWCNAGGRMPAPGPDGASPQPQAMFGPTTYFASHAWVSMCSRMWGGRPRPRGRGLG